MEVGLARDLRHQRLQLLLDAQELVTIVVIQRIGPEAEEARERSWESERRSQEVGVRRESWRKSLRGSGRESERESWRESGRESGRISLRDSWRWS